MWRVDCTRMQNKGFHSHQEIMRKIGTLQCSKQRARGYRWLPVLFLFLLDLSVVLSFTCLDVLFFANYYSTEAFECWSSTMIQWVMSCISDGKMPLFRVASTSAIILGWSALGHKRTLKRGCWWRTVISTQSKNNSRSKAFRQLD